MGFSPISYADVLLIDRVQHTEIKTIPTRGMTMDQVISKFGNPSIKNPAIGLPPITVWHYPKYSVYFENTWVINSVIKKSKPSEKDPKKVK